ncbi:hypothetical protein [Glycomyces algeriensis]|uniref:Uncharacterized protein n=1 Tax=Glycomyces algeriensis TaxID=256037 RepID=A0A9W6G4X3_9ACTN|nr:hypothetical protein [Glycomyces algeriensis]MDA1366937.1 hypothetical protein [Glycomyces algeriensis]MDR7352677.1 hypothetical protein [Glycomyces algeriensis]GLI40358.1 hypothetical protein GALLR39Z86_02080 [Glycomyces algeriensis]
MSGTNRAVDPQHQPGPPAAPEPNVPVPEMPAAYGIVRDTTDDPVWDPAAEPAAPRPVSQRGPLGSQTDGMAAIRAVWERAAETDRRRPAKPGKPQRRREPKAFAPALLGILVCACLLMFFAWTAAPALWISVGHYEYGTVEVTSCQDGFAPSCTGRFEADDWARELHLTGDVTAADLGAQLPARSTGPDAHSAYVGDTAGLLLRWAPSLVLFMAAAFTLVVVSGATRLYEGRSGAIGLCWAAAGAVLAAALAFAW